MPQSSLGLELERMGIDSSQYPLATGNLSVGELADQIVAQRAVSASPAAATPATTVAMPSLQQPGTSALDRIGQIGTVLSNTAAGMQGRPTMTAQQMRRAWGLDPMTQLQSALQVTTQAKATLDALPEADRQKALDAFMPQYLEALGPNGQALAPLLSGAPATGVSTDFIEFLSKNPKYSGPLRAAKKDPRLLQSIVDTAVKDPDAMQQTMDYWSLDGIRKKLAGAVQEVRDQNPNLYNRVARDGVIDWEEMTQINDSAVSRGPRGNQLNGRELAALSRTLIPEVQDILPLQKESMSQKVALARAQARAKQEEELGDEFTLKRPSGETLRVTRKGYGYVDQGGNRVVVGAEDELTPAAGGKGGPKASDVDRIRNQFNSLSKEFIDVRNAFLRIQASAENHTPAGDLSMVFNYMKMLDPGSVVRESEFAAAARAGSYGQRMKAAIKRITDGDILEEGQRLDFLTRASMLMGRQIDAQKKLEDEYGDIAEKQGIDRDLVVVDYMGGFRRETRRGPTPPEGEEDAEFINFSEQHGGRPIFRRPDGSYFAGPSVE